MGVVDRAGKLTLAHRVSVDAYAGWMKGSLVFDNTPLDEALPRLSRWYDIELRLGDPELAEARLTASLRVGALPQALQLLAAALDARFERHGRTVVVYSRRRRP
jgi:transmembrane sensor